MIEMIRQGLKEEGISISMSKLCQWLEISRRTAYYKPTKAAPKVNPELQAPIKALIEQEPSFGYRTVAHLLDMNKNTVQRIFQLMGLAGEEAANWVSSTSPGIAVGGEKPKRALINRSLSCLGWPRWLDHLGPGDRLPYP